MGEIGSVCMCVCGVALIDGMFISCACEWVCGCDCVESVWV